MSYIGRDLRTGAFRQLDDISSGFDGSDTTHTMQVNSQNVTVGDVNQIILSLGGVIQKPGTDFTVSGSVLTFTTAPAANTSFFAILLGSDNGGTVTPTDVSVTKAKLADEVDIFAGTSLSAADLGSGIHIKTADSGASASTAADDLVIEQGSSGNGAGLSILSATDDTCNIFFGDSGDNDVGFIQYNHADNSMKFATAGATQFSVHSNGSLLPGDTDHGIYLGVSSATASNLLNDYEEGTWTPTTSTGQGLTVNGATYKKIGNLVVASFFVTLNTITSTSTSAFQISSLPFTASNNSVYGGGSIGYAGSMDFNDFTDPLIIPNGTYAYYHRNDGSSSSAVTIANMNTLTSGAVPWLGQFIYETA